MEKGTSGGDKWEEGTSEGGDEWDEETSGEGDEWERDVLLNGERVRSRGFNVVEEGVPYTIRKVKKFPVNTINT